MEFHYAALSFLAPEKIKFKYQMEGFDQDWIDAGSRREAYYTNLPPGNYQVPRQGRKQRRRLERDGRKKSRSISTSHLPDSMVQRNCSC